MYWEVYRDFEDLRKSFERIFGETHSKRFPFSRFAFLPGFASRNYPLVNLYEDKDNIYVEALAPGLKTDSIDVNVLRNSLTISGEKAADETIPAESYHRSERAAGKFVRTIEIKSDINQDAIKAEYKNGLLLITLPKVEAAKPKRIAISA